MPKNFEFTVKAWQGITHLAKSPTYKRFMGRLEKPENYGFFQQTDEVIKSWNETEKICTMLKAKYVLFQCPASFKPTDENLQNIIWFFKKIKNPGYRFVWEPRGKAWTDDIILDICKKCILVHCVDHSLRYPVTRDVAYFRLHGSLPGKKCIIMIICLLTTKYNKFFLISLFLCIRRTLLLLNHLYICKSPVFCIFRS